MPYSVAMALSEEGSDVLSSNGILRPLVPRSKFGSRDMGPLFSIVLPMFNVQEFLPDCIESILSQSCGEFEAIFVDDGSTDASPTIVEKYAARDPRIVLLRQDNSGAGAARNHGLSVATGDYLVFLDPDDFFESDLLSSILESIEQHHSDVVLFNARQYKNDSGEYFEPMHYFRPAIVSKYPVFCARDIPDDLFYVTSPAPWTKAFNREFVLREGLRFQEIDNTTDLFFSFAALAIANTISWVDKRLVNYRVGISNSIQGRRWKHPLCFIEAYVGLCEELKRRGLFELLERSFVRAALSTTRYCLETTKRRDTYRVIVRAIQDEPYQSLGLFEHESGFYLAPSDLAYVQGAILGDQWVKNRAERLAIPDTYRVDVRGGDARTTPKVSVIIPVFNVEAYIGSCLESITNQTLRNIEIICVIDGSTDGSERIVREYASSDGRISILVQQNMGLSMARNHGMKESHGEYVYFMDGDDCLDPAALERLTSFADEENLDCVLFDADCIISDETIKRDADLYHRKSRYPALSRGIDLFRMMRENNEFYLSACLYIARREHIQRCGLAFHRGVLHEDNPFTVLLVALASRAGYVSEPYFKRRFRQMSITTMPESFDNSYGYWTSYKDLTERLPEFHAYSDDERQALYDMSIRLLRSAGEIHSRLPLAEQRIYLALDPEERFAFEADVALPAEWKAGMTERQQKLRGCYDEISSLRKDVRALREKERALTKKGDGLKEKNDALKAEVAQLKGRIDSLKRENVELSRRRWDFPGGAALLKAARSVKRRLGK